MIAASLAVSGCTAGDSGSAAPGQESRSFGESFLKKAVAGNRGGATAVVQGDGQTALNVFADGVVDAWNSHDEQNFQSFLCNAELSEALSSGEGIRSLDDFPFSTWVPLTDVVVSSTPHVFDPKNSPAKGYSVPGEEYDIRQALQGGADATSTNPDWPNVGIVFYAAELDDGWCLNDLAFGTS